MKKLSKVLVLVLSTIMVLAMSASVFAAEVTIKDAPADATYEAYKIFDATVSEAGAVSYTIPEGSTLTKAILEGSGLFKCVNNGGKTYVTVVDGKSESEVIAWLKANTSYGIKDTKGTYANGKYTGLDAGYYYIKSSVNNGAVVMLGSATDSVTINEKNTTSGWGDGGKTVDANDKTYNVGEYIKYTLTYKNAVNYSGGEKVYQYVVKDDMPDGVQLVNDADHLITVKVAGTELTKAESGTATGTYLYEVSATDADDFTITIPWAATQTEKLDGTEDFYYAAPSVIEVTYYGKLLAAATDGAANGNTNKATINPNTKTDDPGKEEDVFDGSISITKVDGSDNSIKLENASFVIIDTAAVGEGTQYLTFANDAYGWTTNAEDANIVTLKTDAEGKASVSGLKAGDYYLLETVAPEGYNLAETTTKVTLTNSTTGEGESAVDGMLATPEVENKTGAILPSTGGIGTTIFYVLGSLLVVGCGIVLVSRKRMQNNK